MWNTGICTASWWFRRKKSWFDIANAVHLSLTLLLQGLKKQRTRVISWVWGAHQCYHMPLAYINQICLLLNLKIWVAWDIYTMKLHTWPDAVKIIQKVPRILGLIVALNPLVYLLPGLRLSALWPSCHKNQQAVVKLVSGLYYSWLQVEIYVVFHAKKKKKANMQGN